MLCEAMRHRERCGIGHVVMSGRDQLVLLRPKDEMLVMAILVFPAEIRSAKDFDLESPAKSTPRKTRLAENLIQSWSHGRFHFASYENHYREHLQQLIEAKVAGREVVTPAEPEEAPVINLMDALRRSLARSSSKSKPAATAKRRERRRQNQNASVPRDRSRTSRPRAKQRSAGSGITSLLRGKRPHVPRRHHSAQAGGWRKNPAKAKPIVSSTTQMATKRKKRTFATSAATPSIPVNPNSPATTANRKKKIE